MLNKVKYPIGKFEFYDTRDIDKKIVSKNIIILDQFHAKLKNELNKIPAKYLSKPYRDGGWSIYKLIHHLADSHMHAYIRCKYAYISDKIRIMDYVPEEWANTEDCSFENINYSLIIIKGIHKRWVSFFSKLKNEDFKKQYFYKERDKFYSIYNVLGLYAWHCNHHLKHIENFRKNIKN